MAVCLDSGKLATDACRADVRGNRVAYVNCYPEDAPTESCDKHVFVDYCVTGGGVATDYCYMYPDADVQSRSLVKLNREEVNEIRSALAVGLLDIYGNDGYVYLVDRDGEPISWYGFDGNANSGYDAPYLLCPLHEEAFADPFPEEDPDWPWGDDPFGENPDWPWGDNPNGGEEVG